MLVSGQCSTLSDWRRLAADEHRGGRKSNAAVGFRPALEWSIQDGLVVRRLRGAAIGMQPVFRGLGGVLAGHAGAYGPASSGAARTKHVVNTAYTGAFPVNSRGASRMGVPPDDHRPGQS